MRVLAVDTTSAKNSAALLDHGAIVAEVRLLAGSQHSDRLFRSVRFLLEAGAASLDTIDVFAAVRGPGSFTGLRVGMSAALGFSTAHGRPAAGVSALKVAAWKSGIRNGRIDVWLDAHRGEVYAAAYERTPEGLLEVSPPEAVDPSAWLSRLPDSQSAVFCGDGAERYRDVIERAGRPVHAMGLFYAAAAAEMVWLGHGEPMEPLYVRRTDAEVARERRA